ncbi:G-type lectin S-receptor-like serine/threonine-protein kinase CES101 isoform X2 [Hevea brasiliensis]|uniref:G-type lectin S-receptor-like serine/threonine-protein kinase CES101 isoform X2 n=1 Tax=Hevea brasiliensis TaxID=3981 RepID=UPI0025D117BD|nr:G-type lectin S-receptor-like serine/threonine-protein kinase CES101 isoform X2 [Hevea brasiliensis]
MDTKQRSKILLSSLCYFLLIGLSHSFADTLLQGQQLKDYDHLVSADGTFKLGFFSPGTSRSRYLGIWYNMVDENEVFIAKKKVVWVANRDNPISDSGDILKIDESGKLTILYNEGSSSFPLSSVEAASNVSATLLDSGNFVLKEFNLDGSTKQILWQSFDYPTDTLLPGMKLGFDERKMQVWSLTSWINDNIPAQGSFSLTIGMGRDNSSTQIVIWCKGSIYWTSGMWQNGRFELVSQLSNEGNPNFRFISNDGANYFTYSLSESENHSLSRYMIDSSGSVLEIRGMAPFGACSYKPDPGCVAQKMPECRSQNVSFEARKGFMSAEGQKFDQSYNLSLFDCQAECLNNCSCAAYAYTSVNQTVCELWGQEITFTKKHDETRVIYVLKGKKAKRWIWSAITFSVLVAILVACSVYYFMQRNRTAENDAEQEILLRELEAAATDYSGTRTLNKVRRDWKKSHELHFFSFESIVSATDNFAAANELGKGGFGPVYKGELHGQQVAVKRLSRNSGQGLEEFKNELLLIAKLQHTNLVRLVGCCIQREEKILVYEFMPNKSLDSFLFDPTKKNLLDWKKRLHIIEGIAQGLLYLHKYSRLRIIHRDLKASNILLDAEMNPKISDFGMARIFGRNESEAETRRVVGTHGYMAPEYALKGIVSIKIDVFSFGVLLLEIVSSKKNNSNYGSEYPLNLIGLAWELWIEHRGLELMDPTLDESCPHDEVLRCIHIGLLCVQDQATNRPTMSDIVSMLTNETLDLPAPKQPAFFLHRFEEEPEVPPPNNRHFFSNNNASITVVEAR